MKIPPEAVPYVVGAVERITEVVGDVVWKVFAQQNPELNLAPVRDAGAGMDRARAAAAARAARNAMQSAPPDDDADTLPSADPNDIADPDE
jgi:hypothetical protein